METESRGLVCKVVGGVLAVPPREGVPDLEVGWLPFEVEVVAYDHDTEMTVNAGLLIEADRVVQRVAVVPKPEVPWP